LEGETGYRHSWRFNAYGLGGSSRNAGKGLRRTVCISTGPGCGRGFGNATQTPLGNGASERTDYLHRKICIDGDTSGFDTVDVGFLWSRCKLGGLLAVASTRHWY